jgi:hypothetical protein
LKKLHRISTKSQRYIYATIKEKVGWLFLEKNVHAASDMVGEVFFVNVQKGRKLIQFMHSDDQSALKPVRETIQVREIIRIRSSK